MTIVIIGGGAAGMMAATAAREIIASATIILLEKNQILGRKVLISGGGRCNVTTGVQDVRQLLTYYPRGRKFLTTAFYHFPPGAVFDWFETHGTPLKIEEDNRVFPQSDHGADVVNVFAKFFQEHDIELLMPEAATEVNKQNNHYVITLKSGRTLSADKLIITTGGKAYHHTGSTGDGYYFAETLGHTITPLTSSLNSFMVSEAWPKEHSGVSFTAVGLQTQTDKKYAVQGPIVLTHQGISGPAVFALAAQVAFANYDREHPLPLYLDFVPNRSVEAVAATMARLVQTNPKQQFKKVLHTWLPQALVETMLRLLNLRIDQTNAVTSKAMQHQAVQWLKHCPLAAIGRGAGAEFVTAGGVDTSEVNPKTMESKISPGLFFAGEILNIDGLTGGFNLQAAWATGRLAGKNAASS